MRKVVQAAGLVLAGVVLIAITAVGVKAADRLLQEKMAALKQGAMTAIEELTGRTIRYGDVSPSFFRSIVVHDIQVLDSSAVAAPLLSIREIRITYSLAALVTSRDPVAAIREIQFRNTGIAIDVERDRDVIELLRRLTQPGGGSGRLNATISGSNMSVALTSPRGKVAVSRLSFEIRSRPDAVSVTFRGDTRGTLPGGFAFASSLRAEGTLDPAFTSTDMTVHLLTFQSSLLDAQPQTLQVIWKGTTLSVLKIRDRSPVALGLQADLASGIYTVSFQSEGMRADRVVSFAPTLARFAGWLRVPITASGHVTWDETHKTLEYRVDAAAELTDQLPLRDVSFQAAFSGTEKEVFFQPLRLTSPDGTIEFEGSILFANFYPSGLLTLANIRSGTGEPLSATLNIERLQGSLDVTATHLAIGTVGFDAFHLAMSPAADGAVFSARASFEGTGREDALSANGTLKFGSSLEQAASEGGLSRIGPPRLTVSMGLRNVPPDRLYHLMMGAGDLTVEQEDVARLLGTFTVSADLTLETDFTTVSMDSAAVNVARPAEADTSMSFGLAINSSRLSITGFDGTWRGLRIAGGFEGIYGTGGDVAFTSTLVYQGGTYAFTGSYSPRTGVSARGSYGLVLAAAPQHNGTTSLRIQADHLPIPLRSGPLLASFAVSGLFQDAGHWSADVSSLSVYDVPFLESRKNTISMSGRVTPSRVDLASLSYSDEFSTLSGTAAATVELPQDLLGGSLLDGVSLDGTVTLGSASGESYAVSGGISGGSVSLKGQFARLPLSRLAATAVTGALSGSVTMTGKPADPHLDVTVALRDGKLGTDPLAVSGEVVASSGHLDARSVNVSYLSHRFLDGTVSLQEAAGTLSVRGRYQGEYFADQLAMAVGLEGTFTPDATEVLPDLFGQGMQGKVTLSSITVAGAPFPAWNINLHTAGGRLAFDGGPAGSVTGWVDPSLAFELTLGAPLPVNGRVQGAIHGDQVDATADIETLELAVLNGMLKSGSVLTPDGTFPIYRVTSGVATGSVRAHGPLNDPDFSGELDVVGGGMRSAYSPDEAGPIRTAVTFDGKTLSAAKTTAAVGQGKMSAQASFTMDHWTPVTYDISLATEGSVPPNVRGRFGRLLATGQGSGSIHIAGDDRGTTVTGDLSISECRIALGDMPPGEFVPEESPTVVNVTLHTGRRVEFYWPSLDLPVLRTTAVPGGTIAVTYRGDSGAYTVKGGAGVQGGEIYYFDRTFIMKKGSISFDESQASFDPWITATAEVREWDPDTAEEVKITLNADGPFSKFSPRFTSDPSRSDAAILAMIGAPIVNRAETQGIGLAALVYSDILSQAWILRPFEQKVRQVLNLDMFSIRTQILQNLLAQKLFGSTTNPLDNTSVSLGKYLGNDLFLEMLVRLQQQQLTTGITGIPSGGLTVAGQGLQPDLELTLEWTTPFFLLDWSFLPKHPESLFLSDNSLSLNWRFSY